MHIGIDSLCDYQRDSHLPMSDMVASGAEATCFLNGEVFGANLGQTGSVNSLEVSLCPVDNQCVRDTYAMEYRGF